MIKKKEKKKRKEQRITTEVTPIPAEMPEQRNSRFAACSREVNDIFGQQPLNRLGRMRRLARRKKPFFSRGKKLEEYQMVSANRCAQLQCAFDMCELQVYTCNYWHASARACSNTMRQGPREKREHAIAGCAYPFLRLMSTFAFKKRKEKEKGKKVGV